MLESPAGTALLRGYAAPTPDRSVSPKHVPTHLEVNNLSCSTSTKLVGIKNYNDTIAREEYVNVKIRNPDGNHVYVGFNHKAGNQ